MGKGNSWGQVALLFALGILIASLLLIPQWSLYSLYRTVVAGLIVALVVFARLRCSLRVTCLLVIVLAFYSWAMELSEPAMAPIYGVAGIALAWIAGYGGGKHRILYITLGCIACVLVATIGTAALTFSRKDGSSVAAAIIYAVRMHWRMLIAALIGGISVGIWQQRIGAI
ncbi:hypothetical protein LJC33_03025 [Eubacteriales bacterium OttesenSCG-928-N13]|nr:hypothetical protein [Eubacteriales bacterium OttesenSCG-928-N13]